MDAGEGDPLLSSARSGPWLTRPSRVSASPARRYLALAAPCLGLVLSITLFAVASGWETDHARAELQRESAVLARSFEWALAASEEVLASVGALFTATEGEAVERAEFRAFAANALSRHAEVQAVGWVPLVKRTERAAFERAAQADGLAGFQFLEMVTEGRPGRAAERDRYLPIYYLEPPSDTEAVLGHDLASSPAWLATMERALDTGEAAATDPLSLLAGAEPQTGFLVFQPVYLSSAPHGTVEERRGALRGFALAVYRLGDLAERSIRPLPNPVRLYDESDPAGRRLLYGSGPDPEAGSAFSERVGLNIGGRRWALVVGSAPAEHASEPFSGSVLALVAGLALTATLTAYLHLGGRRASQLLHVNAALEAEIGEKRRAQMELQRSKRALKTLRGSSGALVRASDEHQLLHDICHIAVDEGGYAMAWVGFAEHDERRTVRLVAWAGRDEEAFSAVRVSWADDEWGQGPAGRAIRTGRVQVFGDVLTDERTARWRRDMDRQGIVSQVAFPLTREGVPFGALTICSAERAAFDEGEIALLSELASDLTYGILSIRSEAARREAGARLEESLERLRTTMAGMVQAIGVVTELRDPYTAGHQRRVGRLARSIAQRLGLGPEEVEGIRVAGLIHDIGKISVPAETLAKPGRLTPNEIELIRRHAQSGREILKGIEFPWPIAEMVVQHHERLDGSGYPGGLAGKEILLGARILAVADVVEAMASHRPYRPARGLEEALDEIQRGRGSLFDPEVVDACLKVIESPGFAFD